MNFPKLALQNNGVLLTSGSGKLRKSVNIYVLLGILAVFGWISLCGEAWAAGRLSEYLGKAEPAELVAAAQSVAGSSAEAAPKTWQQRIVEAHPNSDPQYWPESLMLKSMNAEIAEWRRTGGRTASVGAQVAGEPVFQYRVGDGTWCDCDKAFFDVALSKYGDETRTLYTAPAPAPATVDRDAMTRLRRVLGLLDIIIPYHDDDTKLHEAMFTLLGEVARKIEALKAAPAATCPNGCTGPENGGSGCMAVTGDCAMDSTPAAQAEDARGCGMGMDGRCDHADCRSFGSACKVEELHTAPAAQAAMIPFDAINKILSEVMDAAVANGANSISTTR